MFRSLLLVFLGSISLANESVEVGKKLPSVTLNGEEGGRVTGEAWSSDSLVGKVHSIFYVDPGNKKLNEALEAQYKEEKLSHDLHAAAAIINMEAAEMIPNWIISGELRKKQREFPDVVYVKDIHRTLVKKTWQMLDKSVNVIVTDQQGIVRFVSRGPVAKEEFKNFFALIREWMNKNSTSKAVESVSPNLGKSKSPL